MLARVSRWIQKACTVSVEAVQVSSAITSAGQSVRSTGRFDACDQHVYAPFKYFAFVH